MFNKIKVKLFLLFIFFFQQISYAAEIPVIVIAPGKTAQSLNTVGSSVTVIDGETIRTSSHYSLAEIIAESSVSTNMFQMGGHGTNTGIQLRGLEKRYSTVYIDGVKMLDPSASDGSFYMENIMKSSIDRVEILRGTQSSLYGSNAIGGTIHIFTKKGKEGNNQNFEIENGSNNTKNLSYSIDGAGDKFQYYLGFNTLTTHGISAMNNDDEDDEYRNDGIIGNMGYRINDNLKLENSFRLTDSFLEYDTVSSIGVRLVISFFIVFSISLLKTSLSTEIFNLPSLFELLYSFSQKQTSEFISLSGIYIATIASAFSSSKSMLSLSFVASTSSCDVISCTNSVS